MQCAVLRESAGEQNAYRTQLFQLSGFGKTQNPYKTKLSQLFQLLGVSMGITQEIIVSNVGTVLFTLLSFV